MNFSGISRQNLAGRLVRLPLRLIPKGTVMPILQGQLRGKKWTVGVGPHGYWLGSYEYEKQHLFQTTIQAGRVVFDIGANTGFYTLLASHLVGSRGSVVCFEPLPRNVRFLKRHLRLNRIKNVQVIEAAVSDKAGELYFERDMTGLGGHLSSEGDKNFLRVQTVVLDELVAQGKVPIPQYIKIDVEGAEANVLKGARNLLTTHRPLLFLATHGERVHLECCDFLSNIGYKLSSLDSRPLEETDEIIATF